MGGKDNNLRHRNKGTGRDGGDGFRLPSHSRKSESTTDKRTLKIIIALVILLLCGGGLFAYRYYLKVRVRLPLNVPKIIDDNSSHALVDPSRFWGTYRPNLYFGLKTRTPQSPVFGMMWMTQFTGQMPPPLRHWCDQGDGLLRYGWLKHDGKNFGVHEAVEKAGYTIRTEFVKKPGGIHGGEWTTRIIATAHDQQKPLVISLLFYVALDGQGSLKLEMAGKNRLASVIGQSEELGKFKLSFPKMKSQHLPKYDHLISYVKSLDQIKDVAINGMKVEAWDKERTMPYFALGGRLVPRDSPGGPNFMVYQVTVQLPYEMEILFESGSVTNREESLSDIAFLKELAKYSEEFDDKFRQLFNLDLKGFSPEEVNFAQAALSNMIGSVGYFYGSSLVQSKYNTEPVQYWPAPLYTGVPSRSFFPRGFLWDEGFHNLIISRWDIDISKDIISHWLDLINTEGWIPREQILGAESRARVPAEFVVQWNENANPPTLFLPLKKIVFELSQSNKIQDKIFLERLFPRLKVWYDWYNTTQTGNLPTTYRWRGRDPKTKHELNPKTLTSGLDDYPRASHPTDEERHIDLRCWMALASDLMADIAKIIGQDWKDYDATYRLLTDNQLLDELHWSPEKNRYADYGLHTNAVRLEKPKPPQNLQPGQPIPHMDKIRVVLKDPTYQFVDAYGYVSLFPFLLKFIDPNSLKLYQILTDLQKKEELWTDFGLRSLSRKSHLYNRYNTEHDPPYWRGAVWINMNYLALGALHHYSVTPGKYQELAMSTYKALRTAVINNMFSEYRKTGYIWEQYQDKLGSGKGSHPFTGWSALVVLIMAEEY